MGTHPQDALTINIGPAEVRVKDLRLVPLFVFWSEAGKALYRRWEACREGDRDDT